MALNSVKEESRVSSATVVNNQGLIVLLKEIRSMHSKHEGVNHTEAEAKNIVPTTNCSQPWWRGTDCNAGSPAVLVENTSKSSSMEEKDSKLGTSASESQVEGSLNEGDGVTKETNMTSQSGSDGQYGHEHPNLQHVASTLPLTGGEYLIPRAQLELVGHSIACAQYPYSDPYYAGMMTPFGTQTPVHPQLLGMRHTRMPLPLEMAEEPVYVNAKQYHGILRRRQSRAKAELERKLIKSRKPYLHESRHQHAMRRARGCGGRFLNTKKLDNDAANHTSESARLSDSNRNQNSSGGQNMQESNSYSNKDGKGCYQHNQNLPLQSYHSHSSERGEEGDCSGQQRGSIPVNQAPNRALAIQ